MNLEYPQHLLDLHHHLHQKVLKNLMYHLNLMNQMCLKIHLYLNYLMSQMYQMNLKNQMYQMNLKNQKFHLSH